MYDKDNCDVMVQSNDVIFDQFFHEKKNIRKDGVVVIISE